MTIINKNTNTMTSFSWGHSLSFAAIFLICLLLSLWQWDKARHFSKLDNSHLLEDHTENDVSGRLSGHWLNAQFLLDNRTHKGRVGYFQLGLFRVSGESSARVINLGWLPAPVLRSDIPTPFLPSGLQAVHIQSTALVRPKTWGDSSWASPKNSDWPKRIQAIDLDQLSAQANTGLISGYWKLLEGEGKKIEPEKASAYISKHRHQGYALQWFFIALCALSIAVIHNIKSRIKQQDLV